MPRAGIAFTTVLSLTRAWFGGRLFRLRCTVTQSRRREKLAKTAVAVTELFKAHPFFEEIPEFSVSIGAAVTRTTPVPISVTGTTGIGAKKCQNSIRGARNMLRHYDEGEQILSGSNLSGTF
jgi:hypothetical protein